MNNVHTLQKVLEFLNTVPNKKYGDNYALAAELPDIIKNYSLALSTLHLIKKELEGNVIGEETTKHQLELINQVL